MPIAKAHLDRYCYKIFGNLRIKIHNCRERLYSYAQLRYVREVTFAKLLLIDVVVDIDCLMPNIPP